jgi:hypothetical protein
MTDETFDRALDVASWLVTAVAGFGLVYWVLFVLA